MFEKVIPMIKRQLANIMQINMSSEKLLSIDVGFRNIKVAEVEIIEGKEIFLRNYGIAPTPRGCIKNGVISNVSEIKARISKIINENNMKTKNAKIVMSGTSIITRVFMVEKKSNEDVDKTIKTHISELMPINAEKYQVDYKILKEIRDDGKNLIKVFVTAVRKSIIDSYVQVLKEVGLVPVSIDIPSNSVAKFFNRNINVSENEIKNSKVSSSNKKGDSIVAVLDFGSETTIVNILRDKILEFNKVILLGSSNIDEAISDAMKIDVDRGENLKKFYGMVLPDVNSADEHIRVHEPVISVVDKIIKQIGLCFQFYETKCYGESIDKIFIIGGGSLLKGLRPYLEESLGVPVYSTSLLNIDGVRIAQQLDAERLNFLINSVGITLKM